MKYSKEAKGYNGNNGKDRQIEQQISINNNKLDNYKFEKFSIVYDQLQYRHNI